MVIFIVLVFMKTMPLPPCFFKIPLAMKVALGIFGFIVTYAPALQRFRRLMWRHHQGSHSGAFSLNGGEWYTLLFSPKIKHICKTLLFLCFKMLHYCAAGCGSRYGHCLAQVGVGTLIAMRGQWLGLLWFSWHPVTKQNHWMILGVVTLPSWVQEELPFPSLL